jgi:WD40 repeat protein
MRPAGDDGDDEPDRIHFDDFGDHVIGGEERRTSAQASLSSQLQAAVEMRESRRLDNWRKGNWEVRGLSLDPESASNVDHDLLVKDGESTTPPPKVRVCMVAADPAAESRVWIGRTDGSLLAVQLGEDFLTSFRSKLSATFDDATGTAQVANRLVDDAQSNTAPGEEDEEGVQSEGATSTESPFELQCQGTVGSSPVSCVLFDGNGVMFSACRNNGSIQQWRIVELEDEQLQLDRKATLTGAHGQDSTVIMLKTARLDRPVVVSVAHDGSVGLWDASSGALLNQCRIAADDPGHQASFARSADCDGTNIFVGTAQGQVLAFSVRDLLARGQDATASPRGQWTASVDHSVTAIACGGPGALGEGRSASFPSSTLFTGDATGAVKQWEVLTRSIDAGDGGGAATIRLEPWPKLPTQRLQKRAHVFQSMHTDAVTALLPVDSNKVLSASKDGSVVAWNPVTGKSYFFMDGFEKDIRSLCVQENTLVTDGMKHLVCVHDFNADAEVEDDDDWDRFDADR